MSTNNQIGIMSKENEQTSAEKEKSGLRIAQILAAALAAVTAALLGSTIGVAGTVVGAGLASVITTVGGELYLRSLRRTREAARRARLVLATSGMRRRGPLDPAEQPTVQLPRPVPGRTEPPQLEGPPADDEPGRLRKLRWPLIIGTSAVAFTVAILAIVGIESATGTPYGGGDRPIFGGGSGHSVTTTTPTAPPTDSTSTAPSSTPTETSSSSTETSTTPTTSSQPPTTSSAPPSSAGTSANQSQGAAPTSSR